MATIHCPHCQNHVEVAVYPITGDPAIFEKLTRREREIVHCLSSGMGNKQIGGALDISDHTVRHHLQNIFGKTGVHDRTALVIKAMAPPDHERVEDGEDGFERDRRLS